MLMTMLLALVQGHQLSADAPSSSSSLYALNF
jgi:hypothetical protein